MSRLDPNIQNLLRVLLDEGPDAAEAYVRSTFTVRIQQLRSELDKLTAEEANAKNIIGMSIRGIGESTEAAVNTGPDQSQLIWQNSNTIPPDFRSAILAAADAVADANQEIVTTSRVIEALKEKGIVLPGVRPGTSIGNILNKDARWERQGEGIFRRIEESLV